LMGERGVREMNIKGGKTAQNPVVEIEPQRQTWGKRGARVFLENPPNTMEPERKDKNNTITSGGGEKKKQNESIP